MKLFLFLALFVFEAGARTIVLKPSSYAQVDVASEFEAKCSDGNSSVECASMAELLSVELKAQLPLFMDSSHPDNIDLFKSIGKLSDPDLKSMSFWVLGPSGKPEAKEGLIEAALKAMFGENSFLVNEAASILSSYGTDEHEELSDAFEKNHAKSDFRNPEKHEEIYFKEWWYETKSFLASYQLSEQERFMALDVPVTPIWTDEGQASVAGKAYHSHLPMNELLAHFKNVTGNDANPSLDELEKKMHNLATELEVIMRRVQAGDFSQIARAQKVQAEMLSLSQIQMKYAQLGMSDSELRKVTIVFITDTTNPENIDGAILLRQWPFLSGTSVVYVQKFKQFASN